MRDWMRKIFERFFFFFFSFEGRREWDENRWEEGNGGEINFLPW